MVFLNDLSPEERRMLIMQARQMIEEENMEKNAKVMFSMKKRAFMEEIEKEISLKLKYAKFSPEMRKLSQKYTALVNALYKKVVNEKDNVMISISTTEEWNAYVMCATKLRDCIFDICGIKDE